MIVFDGAYTLAYPPSPNFATDSPSVVTLISQTVGGGNTGTAQALWQAYLALSTAKQPGTNVLAGPGALNVIVLFTDGLPNGVSADYGPYIKATSTCQDKTGKIGFLAQWGDGKDPGTTAGLFQNQSAAVTNANQTVIADSVGCAFHGDQTQVRSDVSSFPPQDIYGNATTGYEPVDLTRVDLPTQVDAASTNAAFSAARRIQADVLKTGLNPYIYVIGLVETGDPEPPNPTLMKSMANTPDSVGYNSAVPAGIYIQLTDPAQLNAAFLQVASQILRLTM